MLMKGSRAAGLAALLAGALALVGCGGSRQQVDSFWAGGDLEPGPPQGDEAKDGGAKKLKRDIGAPDDFEQAPAAGGMGPEAPRASTWFGVRHDLALASSPSSPSSKERCSCLAVEVGKAEDPKFQWAAGAPEVGADALVLAFSARGVECPGGSPDEKNRRPSISAVDQEGNDVIVEIEELASGRPLASGAILPKPASGGAVYVKARSSKLPYARAQGGGRCKVY
jgi:hypothetical protein